MSWYTNVGGQQGGPFSEQQIVQMIQAGQLQGAFVSAAGSGQWVPLNSHPPFAQALMGAAGPGATVAGPGGPPPRQQQGYGPGATVAGPGGPMPQQPQGYGPGATVAGPGGPMPPQQQGYGPGATVAGPGGPVPQQQGFGHPGAAPHPGMRRPMPPKKKRSPVATLFIVLGVLGGLGFFAYVVFGRSIERSIDRMGAPEVVKAEVLKVKRSKKKKTLSVTIKVKTKDVKDLRISSTAQRDGEAKPASRYSSYNAFKESRESSHKMDKKRRVKLVYGIGMLKPGKYMATISVSARYSKGTDLEVEFEVPERLATYKDSVACEGRSCKAKVEGPNVVVTAVKGTKVTVGKSTVTTNGKDKQKVQLNFEDKLATVDPRNLSAASFPVNVKFVFTDGVKLDGELKIPGSSLKSSVIAKLKGVQKGGVTFPGDDAAPRKARVLAKMESSTMKLYGSGTGLKSIDLVAFEEGKTRSGSCGSYRNTRTGAVVTVGKTMYDEQVTIYDRRTGRVRMRRLFRAPAPSCPSTMSSKSSVSSFASSSEIETFLKSQI